jgi:hypothetical protein
LVWAWRIHKHRVGHVAFESGLDSNRDEDHVAIRKRWKLHALSVILHAGLVLLEVDVRIVRSFCVLFRLQPLLTRWFETIGKRQTQRHRRLRLADEDRAGSAYGLACASDFFTRCGFTRCGARLNGHDARKGKECPLHSPVQGNGRARREPLFFWDRDTVLDN